MLNSHLIQKMFIDQNAVKEKKNSLLLVVEKKVIRLGFSGAERKEETQNNSAIQLY